MPGLLGLNQEERVCDGCFDLLQHDKGRPVNEAIPGAETHRGAGRGSDVFFRKTMEHCNWDLWDLYGYMIVYGMTWILVHLLNV